MDISHQRTAVTGNRPWVKNGKNNSINVGLNQYTAGASREIQQETETEMEGDG
jgi:hypothetical protein